MQFGFEARGGGGHEIGHGTLAPEGVERIDRRALKRALRDAVKGEVRFDLGTRAIYSHDSSNYSQPPLGVVIPRDTEDVVAAVAVCHAHEAPVLPRARPACRLAVAPPAPPASPPTSPSSSTPRSSCARSSRSKRRGGSPACSR